MWTSNNIQGYQAKRVEIMASLRSRLWCLLALKTWLNMAQHVKKRSDSVKG